MLVVDDRKSIRGYYGREKHLRRIERVTRSKRAIRRRGMNVMRGRGRLPARPRTP